jgi:DnaJ-class molecular chaperone
MNELKNYYEVLEIPSTARSEEIYHSYQRAKSAYSMDSLALYSLMSPEECRNVLELVEEAYSILSDPMKRKRYDEARGFNREFNTMNYNTLADRVPQRNELRSERSEIRSEIRKDMRSEIFPSNSTSTSVSSMLRDEFTLNTNANTAPTASSLSPRQEQTLTNTTTNVTKLVTQKRFALDYVINAEFEKEIEEATEYTGDFLRKIREYKSVDLERLSDMTKVSRLYLQAIENEDYDKLPA